MFSDVEISVFMEELEEKVQAINDNILILEREGENPQVIQEIFRAAHTIKGSSAVMGYEKMANLTHEIENLFDRLRQGTMQVSESLIDTLFEALDTLKLLKEEITGENVEVDVHDVITKLGRCQNACDSTEQIIIPPAQSEEVAYEANKSDFTLDDVEENMVREAELRGYQSYWLTIELDPGCQMKSVRAFLVFESLQRIGDIIKSSPPAEEIQDGKFTRSFSLILLSKEDTEYIKNLLYSIAEISDVSIKSIELNSGEEELPEETPVGNGTNKAEQAAINQQEEKDTQTNTKVENKVAQNKQNKVKQNNVNIEKTNIKTVRVDVQKLDTLMNLVGELVIDRTRLDRFVEVFEGKYGSDDLAENIVEISNHLGQVTGDLQEEIMKARMLPVANVFNRLPRMVRDIAHKLGREIDFIIEGRETELDRNVIEVIGDPLIHLLRNAIDHGIEPPDIREQLGKPRKGLVKLKASYVESHIMITLEDDGKGIDALALRKKAVEKGLFTPEAVERMSDRDALDLIFSPGFSTASNVSEVSGRGVGMDIVRSQIEQINGTVEFTSAVGQGTTFIIKLPLTLAIIRALMVGLGDQVYAFPLTNVHETLAIKPTEIKQVGHTEVIIVRGHVLPLVRLAHLFNEAENNEDGKIYIVLLGSGDKKVGVVVNHLIGEQEIVIKSMGSYLGQITGLSGATILGDGRVALIVDARGIVKDIGIEEVTYAAAN